MNLKKISSPLFFEIVIVASLFLGGFLLFWQEKVHHNLDYQKSWVNFYFTNPDVPTEGVEFNNHLGYSNSFRLCLIPDSENLIEPKDLSCNSDTVKVAKEATVEAGKSFSWKWEKPQENLKYWVVLQYITKDGNEIKRSLGFWN